MLCEAEFEWPKEADTITLDLTKWPEVALGAEPFARAFDDLTMASANSSQQS